MSRLSEPEIVTQKRLINLLSQTMNYDYLGEWKERENNSNIEEAYLKQNLSQRGYNDAQISRSIELLKRETANSQKNLYQRNQEVYGC